MYNLLMAYDPEYWNKGSASWDYSRFLEYTNDDIKERFKALTPEIIQELKTLPTLFTHEFSQLESARVGWITDIQRRGNKLRISFSFDSTIPPITPEQLKSLLWELDMESETSRTHWAVKDIDLLSVLEKAGLLVINNKLEPRNYKFSRQTIIKACDLLKNITHAKFDQLLIEIGLDHIDAGRNHGGLLARSVALCKYVVDHMEEITVEGEPLALVLVRYVAQLNPEDSLLGGESPVRNAFWANLKSDGYTSENNNILPLNVTSTTNTVAPYYSNRYQSISAVVTPPRNIRALSMNQKPKIFIVHGRDPLSKTEVARFLAEIGLKAVILHERPNGGRTLIAKFQEESADIQFAIVLMTPDDVGGLLSEEQRPRARQNVIFELGFFIGKLGASKVCALVKGAIERPSDFDAVVYTTYDEGGAWKLELARELKHAKIPFDEPAVFQYS